jgi:hypothetical protein
MNDLFIDYRAIEFMKKAIESEKASSMRIFTSGGGITVYVEKAIADNTGTVSINFNEKKELLIEFR